MSGAKLQGKARMVTQSFRAEPEQLQKFAALGGGAWMRQMLDATPWPRGTKPAKSGRQPVVFDPGYEGRK